MLITLTHTTTYRYDRLTQLGSHVVRLRPTPYCKVPIKAYSLTIHPNTYFINWQYDAIGNFVAYIDFFEPTKRLSLTVDLVVEKISINPFDFFISNDTFMIPISYPPAMKESLYPYLNYQPCKEIEKWLEKRKCNTHYTLDFLVNINQLIYQEFEYQTRLEPGVRSPTETLTFYSGSCRDLAWFECLALRQLGFATRFVSGYLIQLVNIEENPAVISDSLDLHAWCEVYLPGAGWIGFDPTSGLLAADQHIPLCAAPTPHEAAAITGQISLSQSTLETQMIIQRIETSSFQSTTPIPPDQWQSIHHTAKHIDHFFESEGIDLTIGGEPTFVKKNHIYDPQWQTEALGEEKFHLGTMISADLKQVFAANGIGLLTQGKWYPGENLPRWAYCTYWRKDNEPLWENSQLLDIKHKKNVELSDIKRLLLDLADILHLQKGCVQPIYEDIWYQLWLIGKLGHGIDVSTVHLNTHDAQMLSRSLYHDDLTKPAGFCLPLAWDMELQEWVSCLWQTIAGKITALPGESSLGYRLPLDKLETQFKFSFAESPDRSLFESSEPLPSYASFKYKYSKGLVKGRVIDRFIRTACCVEIRNDHVYVFIPPIKPLVAYCELLVALELCVNKYGLSIQLEGYSPELEHQLTCFSVTPDPGVLEINVHPARNWQDIVTIQETVFDITSRYDLSSYKYTRDGRQIPTGGGCHITLGASIPSNSLFLKQPDVLRSMLTYWQHHPSLSYLFSGLFIGPNSQAPRIDEARHDSLYELELAFNQIPLGNVDNFWLIDRLLRHLLVDVTGNTHRAEFCIDKLFSPDHEGGRQGLLELRSFEMQPHPQLNCLQQLLIRGLIATFLKQPYHHQLTRWGTELHDRFMLPHFIWNDFYYVITTIQQAGFSIQDDWFKPIFEHRFPLIGSLCIQDVQIELRHALEPWPVLGETNQSRQTSRVVDSSLERIQILCRNLNQEKMMISCNKVEIPLQTTGTCGEYIAGIRFKAWNFKDCLHPNIPAMNTLTFDLIDRQSKRALGGFQYFNQPPSGKNPEQFPAHQREAETRRQARFQAFGHSPGMITILKPVMNPEYPYTLDLRQASQKTGTEQDVSSEKSYFSI